MVTRLHLEFLVEASRFGASSDPYYVVAHGGGGGGSHSQPNWHSNGSKPFNYMSSWLVDDTAPPSFYTTANALWNPNVPGGGGNSFSGGGPRAGGCGGGSPFNQNQNPGSWPFLGAENPTGNNYAGETGGVGTQKLAPGISGAYGYGAPGYRAALGVIQTNLLVVVALIIVVKEKIIAT